MMTLWKNSHYGELMALGSGLCWSIALIYYKKVSEVFSANQINFFKNGLTLLCLLPVFLLEQNTLSLQQTYNYENIAILLLSGLVGITFADTLYLKSLKILGAGNAAIVTTADTPIMVLLSVLFLGEHLTLYHILGIFLILGANLITAYGQPSQSSNFDTSLDSNSYIRNNKYFLKGMGLCLLSLLLMGLSLILIKDRIEKLPLIGTSFIRVVGGVFSLMVIEFFRGKKLYVPNMVHNKVHFKNLVLGSLLGGFLTTYFWLGSFKYTKASIASILSQSQTLFIILLAAIYLKEPLTPKKWIAAIMGLCGIIAVVGN